MVFMSDFYRNISLEFISPQGYKQPQEAISPVTKIARKITGYVFAKRHFTAAFTSSPHISWKSRLFNVIIGLVELMPFLGKIAAITEKSLLEKKETNLPSHISSSEQYTSLLKDICQKETSSISLAFLGENHWDIAFKQQFLEKHQLLGKANRGSLQVDCRQESYFTKNNNGDVYFGVPLSINEKNQEKSLYIQGTGKIIQGQLQITSLTPSGLLLRPTSKTEWERRIKDYLGFLKDTTPPQGVGAHIYIFSRLLQTGAFGTWGSSAFPWDVTISYEDSENEKSLTYSIDLKEKEKSSPYKIVIEMEKQKIKQAELKKLVE